MARSLGTPVWIDLGSGNLEASKTFYQGLFGWSFEDSGNQMMNYNMVRNNGSLVGGAMSTQGMTSPDGGATPSSWTAFLAVDDVDARTALAAQHGARVIREPADAGDAGRLSLLIDPSGAAVGFWQAGDTEGYDFTAQPGSPAWFEVMAQDYQAACDFYTAVLDFTLVPMTGDDGQPINYCTNGPVESATSGICDASGLIPREMGSFWRTYFLVENADASVAKVTSLGGRLLDGPQDSPFGRIATVADPEGAPFQICQAPSNDAS